MYVPECRLGRGCMRSACAVEGVLMCFIKREEGIYLVEAWYGVGEEDASVGPC